MATLALLVLGLVVVPIGVALYVSTVIRLGAKWDRARFKRSMRAQRYDLDPKLTPWED